MSLQDSKKTCDSFKLRETRCCSIMDALMKDRESNETCDVVLVVENQRINAHKNILISCSQYFRAMFTGAFQETEKGFVTLKDISYKEFFWLLEYMYGNETKFETKSSEEILAALDLADMLCLDMFTLECKAFVENWRIYEKFEVSYVLAKKLRMSGVENQLKRHVFRQMVPTNVLKCKEEVNMENVSYELLLDTLNMFENPAQLSVDDIGFTGKVQELTIVSSIRKRLEGILTWIAFHPDQNVEDYLSLLNISGIEGLPNFEVGNAIGNAFGNALALNNDKNFEVAAIAVNEKLSKIENQVSTLKIRATIVEVQGYTVKVADYHFDYQRWNEFSFHVGVKIAHTCVSSDVIYLLGDNDLFTYDMKIKSLPTKRKLLLLDEQFECLKVFAYKNIIYLYGRNSQSNNVILGIYNVTTSDLSRRELTLQYCDGSATALTVSNNDIYFKNEYYIYKYNYKDNILEIACGTNPIAERQNPKILPIDNDIFVFTENATYAKNSFKTLGYCQSEPLMKDKLQYKTSSVCSSNSNVIVALYHNSYEGHTRLLHRKHQHGSFKYLAFLPYQKMMESPNANFILRQDN